MICKRVCYTGKVQGVGFRYTTQGIAAGYQVVGYVRNLKTGDVELVAQGAADQVDAFLAAVASRMSNYIRQADVQDAPAGEYRGFQIRY
jgi:acylphosphatase